MWHFPMLLLGLPMAQTLQSVSDGPVPTIASRVSVLHSIFHPFSLSGAVTNRQLGRDALEFLSPKADSNSISRNHRRACGSLQCSQLKVPGLFG